MLVYSGIYLLNSFAIFANPKNKKILNVVVLLSLVFITGFRYYMGGLDVYTYEKTYNEVPSVQNVLNYLFFGVNENINENYEVGFLFLCAVIKSLGFSYFGFIIIYTLLFYTLMVKGLREFVSDWAAFFAIFMYKIMFYNTFISIRQGLTTAMFCFMLRYIRDRKWYIYFPWCILAFLEHRAAVILFPLYFITYMPTSKKFIRNYAIILAPTWLIRSRIDLSGVMKFVSDIIQNDRALEHWIESTEQISIIHTIECYIFVILILLFYEKIMSNYRKKEVKLVLQIFLLTIPIFTIFSNWIFLTRIKDYFVLMYGIILGYIIEGRTTSIINHDYFVRRRYLRVGENNFKIIALAILMACFIGMYRFVATFDAGELMNYQSIFFKDVSIWELR